MNLQRLSLAGLLAAVVCHLQVASAQVWVSNNAPNQPWSAIACSADGSRLVAAINYGRIYSSTNSGQSWATNGAPLNDWVSVASSADGNRLAAAASISDTLYVSTNAGSSWKVSGAPGVPWISVASSADGLKLFAAPSTGYCCYSTNAGVKWATLSNAVNLSWSSAACSADGIKLLAIQNRDDPAVYVSTNAGQSWTTNLTIIGQPGAGCASSADGTKMFLLTSGMLYFSTNFGVSWVHGANAKGSSIACSADGVQLFVAAITQPGISDDFTVYLSMNLGMSWTSYVVTNNASNANNNGIFVTSSADGMKLALIGPGSPKTGGAIYTSQSVAQPRLNLASSGTNLQLAWIIPSTNFILQQSPDLLNWSGPTNTPLLNLTNLQYQVTLSSSNSCGFYRLATP